MALWVLSCKSDLNCSNILGVNSLCAVISPVCVTGFLRQYYYGRFTQVAECILPLLWVKLSTEKIMHAL